MTRILVLTLQSTIKIKRWFRSNLSWYGNMEWIMEENFSMEWNMEWKIFKMKWK